MDLVYTLLYNIGDPLVLIPDSEYNRISGMGIVNRNQEFKIIDENNNQIAAWNQKDKPAAAEHFQNAHREGFKSFFTLSFTVDDYEQAVKAGSLLGLGKPK